MDTHHAATQIDLLTRNHRYVGLVNTRGIRLADILNDGNSSILEMEDIVVTAKGVRPADLRTPHLLLRKQEVLAVFLAGEHEAPVRRSNNRVERRRFGALVMLPNLMLSGLIHLPSRVGAESLITANSLLPSFLALTSVAIHSSHFDLVDSAYQVAIVRREWIEAVELSGELVHS